MNPRFLQKCTWRNQKVLANCILQQLHPFGHSYPLQLNLPPQSLLLILKFLNFLAFQLKSLKLIQILLKKQKPKENMKIYRRFTDLELGAILSLEKFEKGHFKHLRKKDKRIILLSR
jgi:hypothetical protein